MNQTKGFEQLDVFQRAYKISLKIHKASLKFPSIEQYAIADQTRRASKSVCANIVEGFAKQVYSKAEFKRYLMNALGSSDECACGSDIAMILSISLKNNGKNGGMNTAPFPG